jgi:hypothetical protein
MGSLAIVRASTSTIIGRTGAPNRVERGACVGRIDRTAAAPRPAILEPGPRFPAAQTAALAWVAAQGGQNLHLPLHQPGTAGGHRSAPSQKQRAGSGIGSSCCRVNIEAKLDSILEGRSEGNPKAEIRKQSAKRVVRVSQFGLILSGRAGLRLPGP